MGTVSSNRRLVASMAAGLLTARARPGVVAEDATPAPAGLDDGSLPAILAGAYDPIPNGGPGPSSLFTYANIARQLEVRGLRMPDPTFRDKDRFSE